MKKKTQPIEAGAGRCNSRSSSATPSATGHGSGLPSSTAGCVLLPRTIIQRSSSPAIARRSISSLLRLLLHLTMPATRSAKKLAPSTPPARPTVTVGDEAPLTLVPLT
uniref:Uncharacterized protein n=1 Tax=Arundo donax TaxID=35708 RepID=A0A0A8XUQ6_ARUDO